MLERFIRNEDGNFATIMALVLVPLMGIAGAAYDYSKLKEKKQDIQAAADIALLAAAKDANSSTEFYRLAEIYFNANYPGEEVSTYAKANPTSVSLSIHDSYHTAVMGIVGVPRIDFEVHSEVAVNKFGKGSLGGNQKLALDELKRIEEHLLKQTDRLRSRDQAAARANIRRKFEKMRKQVSSAGNSAPIHLMK